MVFEQFVGQSGVGLFECIDLGCEGVEIVFEFQYCALAGGELGDQQLTV